MLHHITDPIFVTQGEALIDTASGTLIVDPLAFLISNSNTTVRVSGSWTMILNGSVEALATFGGFDYPAISISASVPTDSSSITIGKSSLVMTVQGDAIACSETTSITNNGTIFAKGLSTFGSAIVEAATGDHTIRNTGRIESTPLSGTAAIREQGDGVHTITNSGMLKGFYAIRATGPNGREIVTNSGTMSGQIALGAGADSFTDFAVVGGVVVNGTLIGATVDLGAGDDTFVGGANMESVLDGDGSDVVNLGGGNDTYLAVGATGFDGTDRINGGAGFDNYAALSAVNPVSINLAASVQLGIAANTAFGADIAGTGVDRIFNFENAYGGSGDDKIAGSSVANFLAGGLGADTLVGGGGADVFSYVTSADSTVAHPDNILDFSHLQHDTIDLSAIDAIAGGTDDPFHLTAGNGTGAFTHAAGELRYSFISGNTQTLIEGDINGDGGADFAIVLAGKINLTATDFRL